MPSIGDLVVNLKANSTDFSTKMQGAKKSLASFQAEALATAAAIGAAFGYSSKVFLEYDDAIRAVAAVTQTSGTPAFEAMNQKAKELGRTTSFTAVEVANLMRELGQAGFDPRQINEMTSSVLSLSRATGTDAAESAGIMSATIRQFGLEASDAGRVADVLALTSSKTFTTVSQLGEAFSYVGTVMSEMNIPLEEAAAALGMLGNVGIQGSEAGTAFRRFALLTTSEAHKMEEIFGVSFRGANGSIMSLTDTLATLQSALSGMREAEAVTALNEAFGLLGITGAAALARSGDGVKDLNNQLLQAKNAAENMAAEMDAGSGGAFRRMMSAVEGLSIEIGRRLAPAFETLVNSIASAAAFATKYANVLVPIAVGTLAVVTAMLALAAAEKAVAIAMRLRLAFSGPKGWAILAAGVAAAAVATYAMAGAETTLTEEIAKANKAANGGAAAVKKMGDAAKSTETAMKTGGDAVATYRQMVEELLTPTERIASKIEEFKSAINAAGGIGEGHPLVKTMIEQESGFSSAVQSITEELAILRGEATETGIELQKMLSAGVDPTQIEALRKLYAEREQIKKDEATAQQQESDKEYWANRDAEMQKAADDIIKSLRTPEQILEDEIKRVQEFVKAGKLTQEQADAFIAKQNTTDSNIPTRQPEPRFAGIMERGSEAALQSILMANSRNPELTESKKHTKLLEKIFKKKEPKMKTIPFVIQKAVS